MRAVAGTRHLVRLAFRRDRILLPAWIATFVLMVSFSAAATIDLYPTAASRIQAVATLNETPALVAFYGRIYSPSIGALSLIKMGGIGAALLAVLAFMLVIRHTRAEEEAGRLELLGSTVVGGSAALTAAIVIAGGTSVVIGTLSAIGLIAAGLPAAGSVAFGFAWASTGLVFTAIGAFTAQLSASRHVATGIAAAALGVAYVLRAVGDAAGHGEAMWVSWLSPIGWSQQVRPFAHERWLVLSLPLLFAGVVVAGAYVLSGRRDLGSGLLPDRAGPAVADPSFASPVALAWRLQRGTFVAWLGAVVAMSAMIGGIATSVSGIIDNPAAQEFITKLGGTKALTDAYLALELGMLGSIVSIFGMQTAMRLRSEEVSWRTDLLLSTATGRVRWVASHVTIAVVGTCVVLLGGGLATGVAYAAQVGDASQIARVLAGAAVQIPAACVMVAIVVAAFGFVPRLTTATWALLVAFLLLGEFGTLFDVPRRIMDLSPFAHVPRIPGGTIEAAPLLGLMLVAIVLGGAGIVAFTQRDVEA